MFRFKIVRIAYYLARFAWRMFEQRLLEVRVWWGLPFRFTPPRWQDGVHTYVAM